MKPKVLIICQNWAVYSVRAQTKTVSLAELSKVSLMTKLVILPEKVQFGKKSELSVRQN